MNRLLSLLLLLFSVVCSGQINVFIDQEVPVIVGDDTLDLAWAGGMNSPQVSNIDLNQDGVLDIVTFERGYFGRFKTYVLEDGAYRYAPEYIDRFPECHSWALLIDYNCDGKPDLFTHVPGAMAVYMNTTVPGGELTYTLINDYVMTQGNNYTNLYISASDLPAILDVDNDGDIDVLTFDPQGAHIEYHQNQSMENYGHCDSLEFVKVEECWGYFEEDAFTNNLVLDIDCNKKHQEVTAGARHAGSSLLAFDNDADGDKEILLGDVSYENLIFGRNGGDLNNAQIDSVAINFPSNTTPVSISLFPAAYYVELYNENAKSLVVASNLTTLAKDVKNVWRYSNSGATDQPIFNFEENDFLQGKMMDEGTGARPILLDYNADGLMDLVVANIYLYHPVGGSYSSLSLYLNVGSATNPAFELTNSNLFELDTLQLTTLHPAFGDIDQDGDIDIFIGDGNGEISFLENQSSTSGVYDYPTVLRDVGNIDVGSASAPILYDLNEDGLLDLLLGQKRGELTYIPNTGTLASFDFQMDNAILNYGGVDVMIPCCTGYSVPFIYEKNNQPVLVVGGEDGLIHQYTDFDLSGATNFVMTDSLISYSYRVGAVVYDFDSDGKEDWIVGEYFGGLNYYKGGVPDAIHEQLVETVHFYPNPVHETLHLSVLNGKAVIYDLAGKKIGEQTIANGQIDVRTCLPGVYIVKIIQENSISAIKVVIE